MRPPALTQCQNSRGFLRNAFTKSASWTDDGAAFVETCRVAGLPAAGQSCNSARPYLEERAQFDDDEMAP